MFFLYNYTDAMNISESGQNREIAALRVTVHVHHLFWSDICFMDDCEYMMMALEEAYKAYDIDEIPVGAVIVLNDTVVSKAHNLKDSSGVVTNHAEILAIEGANKKIGDWRLNDAIMYVTLEPCPMCAGAIQQSRISKVVYGTSSNSLNNFKIISSIFNNYESNHIVEIERSTCLNNECQNVINDFFKKIR